MFDAITQMAQAIRSGNTLLADILQLHAPGMGTLHVEGDTVIVPLIVFKPENTQASTKILKLLVNDGVVKLSEPDKDKLL